MDHGGLEEGTTRNFGGDINVPILTGVLDKWVHMFVKMHLIVQWRPGISLRKFNFTYKKNHNRDI